MNWGSNVNNQNQNYPDLQKIFIQARTINLLWRHEILTENQMDSTTMIDLMEDDIFWDLAEIDLENNVTKSLRMTNLGLKSLPPTLDIPVKTQIIDFSGNNLSEIPSSWFEHLSELRVLRIANNEFKSIPWESLSQLTSIKIIDFRNNLWDQSFIDKFESFIRVFSDELIKVYW